MLLLHFQFPNNPYTIRNNKLLKDLRENLIFLATFFKNLPYNALRGPKIFQKSFFLILTTVLTPTLYILAMVLYEVPFFNSSMISPYCL